MVENHERPYPRHAPAGRPGYGPDAHPRLAGAAPAGLSRPVPPSRSAAAAPPRPAPAVAPPPVGRAAEGGAPSPTAGLAQWPALLVDYLLLGAALVMAFYPSRALNDTKDRVYILTGAVWLLLGLVFIVVRLSRMRRSRRGDAEWPRWLAGRRTGYLIILATVITVFNSGFVVAETRHDNNLAAVRVLSVSMVLVAWAVLQLSYAERYARIWLSTPRGEGREPLSFPGTPSPTLVEFTYFAATVGTTFSTSDVEVRGTGVRSVVLWHGLLAFVYNTAILGMVISLLTTG